MRTVLLDTNVVSYLMKNHPLARRFAPHLAGKSLAISFMSVAELHEGAARARRGAARLRQLEEVLESYLVIGPDPDMCRLWGQVRAMRRQRPIASDDAWIAATALDRAIPLVTNDVADFSGIPGLQVLSPV